MSEPLSLTKSRGKTESEDRFFFYACIIDIFFLPYFWIVTIPYSMPLVLYWFFKRFSVVSRRREFPLLHILIFLMVLSTLLSYLINPDHVYKNSTVLIELLTMFIYYFMFAYYVDSYPVDLKRILVTFIFFAAAFAVLYNFDKSLYQQVKYIWNPRMGTVWSTDNFHGYRFGFFWMDENNIGYAVNAIVVFLFLNEKVSLFTKTMLTLATLFILTACMSNGGFLSFIIAFGFYLLITFRRIYKLRITYRFKTVNIMLFIFLLVLLFFLIPHIQEYLNSEIVKESFDRIKNNTADSRISIWKSILGTTNFFEYIFLGQGSDTIVNGIKVNPHNGHIFWILAYGMISYGIFLYLFFRKRKITPFSQYLFMIPIWIGFTINILIGELKFSAILALLVACSSSQLYLSKNSTQRGGKAVICVDSSTSTN